MSLASAPTQEHNALVAPIARAVAGRYRQADPGELHQLGAIAALAAIADLDPARADVSQRAYLRLRIRGAMLDPIRRELDRREVSFDTAGDTGFGTQTMQKYGSVREVSQKSDTGHVRTLDIGMFEHLPARERQILELRIAGWSQAETGLQLGVSQSRVSRIEARAVRELRRRAQ